MGPHPDLPTLGAIVPVHNGARFLAAALQPLRASLGSALSELWVVDDASTDDSAEIAEGLGARVLRMSKRSGPAAARNLGAERAGADVLVFVDADVVVHPQALERIRDALCDPALCAVFGSYDDRPPERNFASLYMNLRHHQVHQRNAGATTSFWSGFGAVRRGVFLDLGGFDAKQFREPSIEDVEFGNRLARRGAKIKLDAGLLCTHQKRWRLGEALRTDWTRRALPWSRLLLRADSIRESRLNLSAAERARAALAIGAFCSLALAALGVVPWWAAAAFWGTALASSGELGGLLYRRGGALRALGGLLYHQFYYLYSTLIYGSCWMAMRIWHR